MGKKKTAEQKKLEGTERADRPEMALPKKKIDIPKHESYLNPAQVKIYKRICEHINDHSLLQNIDSFYVSQVAVSMWNVAKYTRVTNKEGLVQIYQSGATNTSGYYNALKGEREFLKDANKQLGLTIKAREDLASFAERVKPLKDSNKESKPVDPFENKLKKVG